MNIIPIFNQFDVYEYDFQLDVEDIVEDTLGEDISISQKEELANSITFLIDKYSKKYCRYLDSQFAGTNNMFFVPNCESKPSSKLISTAAINYIPQNLFTSMAPQFHQIPIKCNCSHNSGLHLMIHL